ncbi:hypothetical protein BDZ90DRAFT_267390 [Jaminaea rosea]|uniref:RanBP2-type domain-containing protein n=1 Tax=Jaminaea rosea TaxID=1569628 RepID=A0A316UQZ6_9BASI|nr:hypothetical protein BDZ90DRAFT_267390 [Jaminaea rosea]PWN26293.1 hypothetical protein BDZ90DRAFT_267390 [Jaminaea rosea]
MALEQPASTVTQDCKLEEHTGHHEQQQQQQRQPSPFVHRAFEEHADTQTRSLGMELPQVRKHTRSNAGSPASSTASPSSLALHASLPPKVSTISGFDLRYCLVVTSTSPQPASPKPALMKLQSPSSDSLRGQLGSDTNVRDGTPPPKSIPIIRRAPLSFFPPAKTPTLVTPVMSAPSLDARPLNAANHDTSTLLAASQSFSGSSAASPPLTRQLLGSQASMYAPRAGGPLHFGATLSTPPVSMAGPQSPPYVFGPQASSMPFTSPIPAAAPLQPMSTPSPHQIVTAQQQAALSTAMHLASFGVGFGPGVNPDAAPILSSSAGDGLSSTSGNGSRSGGPTNVPPIINTGNLGPMCVQPGDWVCSVCSFVNWRRRKVCMRCYPFAEGNEVAASLASGAALAAQLAAGIPANPSQIDQLAKPTSRNRGDLTPSSSSAFAPTNRGEPLHSSPSATSGSNAGQSSSFNSGSGLDAMHEERSYRLDSSPRSGKYSQPLVTVGSPPSSSSMTAIEVAREALPRRAAARSDSVGTPGLDSLLSTALRLSESKSGMLAAPSRVAVDARSSSGSSLQISSSGGLLTPSALGLGQMPSSSGIDPGRSLPASPFGGYVPGQTRSNGSGTDSAYLTDGLSPLPHKSSSPFSSPRPSLEHRDRVHDQDFDSSPPTASSSTTTLMSPSMSLSPPTSNSISNTSCSSLSTSATSPAVSIGPTNLSNSPVRSGCFPGGGSLGSHNPYFCETHVRGSIGSLRTGAAQLGLSEMSSGGPDSNFSTNEDIAEHNSMGNVNDGMLGLRMGSIGSGGLPAGGARAQGSPGFGLRTRSLRASRPLPPPRPSTGNARDIWLDDGMVTSASRSRTLPASALAAGLRQVAESSSNTASQIGSNSSHSTQLSSVEQRFFPPGGGPTLRRSRAFYGRLPGAGEIGLAKQVHAEHEEDHLISPNDLDRPRPDPIGTRSSPTKRTVELSAAATAGPQP